MQSTECIQGRWITEGDVDWLRAWIGSRADLSRKGLAKELCHLWQWKDSRGRLKDFAARSFLLKLEARGWIRLPALRTRMRRQRAGGGKLEGWRQPEQWLGGLRDLQPICLEVMGVGQAQRDRWELYLRRYHYLGFHVVGENLGYLVKDCRGKDLGCLLFGAAAWRCAPRDEFFKWDETTRRQRLCQVANNTRFLILPWVRVSGLASHVLAKVADRIQADWTVKYGHGLEWLETFVEAGRFAGTCYRAANWQRVGQTTGRSRQDRRHQLEVPIKDIYLYRLRR